MHQGLRSSLAFTFLSAISPAQAAWQLLYPSASPPGRVEALAGCFESTGDVLFLFGSFPFSMPALDCWRFDGMTWTQVTTTLPPYRTDGAMVYDRVRNRLVLFGGWWNQVLQDTWLWNGTTWVNPNPAVKPPSRRDHVMAFDRKRGVTVLFSGYGSSGVISDLWEWNGTAWSQRAFALQPAARRSAQLAFDPSRESLLLFGGRDDNTVFTDTWSFDGTTWQQRQPATPPVGDAMVADLHRRRVVMLFGNLDQFAWEWDGAEWSERLQTSPAYRTGASFVYDPARRRCVMVGGNRNGHFVSEAWIYRTPNPADVLPFGAGCAGTAGVPALANAPYSLPWLGDTSTNRVTYLAPAAVGVVFATGFQSTAPISLAPYGMPGCDQLVIPATTEFRLASAGAASWGLAIPNTTALANVHLFQQVFALDPTANALGLTASNGVEMTTGIR